MCTRHPFRTAKAAYDAGAAPVTTRRGFCSELGVCNRANAVECCAKYYAVKRNHPNISRACMARHRAIAWGVGAAGVATTLGAGVLWYFSQSDANSESLEKVTRAAEKAVDETVEKTRS